MNAYNRPEKKFFDQVLSDTTVAAAGSQLIVTGQSPTGTSSTFVGIPQGTTESERIGRKCTITKIMCRFHFKWKALPETTVPNGTDETTETIRLIIYWDKQCNGASATALDILETDTYNSYRNLANKGRFVHLYDKLATFNTAQIISGNGTTQVSAPERRAYILKMNKTVFIPIEYDSTTGAVTEIKSNNIGCRIWAKDGASLELLDSVMRIRFADY